MAIRSTSELEKTLGAALATDVLRVRAVGGGSICSAYRAELAGGRAAFVKTVARPRRDFFSAEAAGLELLAAAVAGGGVPVPGVLAVTEDLLALEWVDPGPPGPDAADAFGRALALTHRHGAPEFGRSVAGSPAGSSGFIGSLPMDNTPAPAWPEFYAERRVRPYLRGTVDRRSISRADAADVERVLDRIETLAGPPEPPALLHGDLWSGNVLWTGAEAVLVDPAAHGGHRETDLAMLALFGAPYLARILAAYDGAAPLAPGWRERVALHQLHPVLVHAVLFGGSYGPQAGALAREALAAGT